MKSAQTHTHTHSIAPQHVLEAVCISRVLSAAVAPYALTACPQLKTKKIIMLYLLCQYASRFVRFRWKAVLHESAYCAAPWFHHFQAGFPSFFSFLYHSFWTGISAPYGRRLVNSIIAPAANSSLGSVGRLQMHFSHFLSAAKRYRWGEAPEMMQIPGERLQIP